MLVMNGFAPRQAWQSNVKPRAKSWYDGGTRHLTPALSPSAPQTPPTRRGRNASNVLTKSHVGSPGSSKCEAFVQIRGYGELVSFAAGRGSNPNSRRKGSWGARMSARFFVN